ncbi:hypothetical protein AFR_12335 [Actinoplanes friuliensis DSM 7358]|uniref:SnoaL-like domain-containing protein n=2 Tax=Actinoplanes friuliensis TaxID=196914 RepID=U5VUT4_9ACTN|nr:hypothetical protein AFR_12335 [Actinoplanes friuliensis DSM 7358]
MTFSVVNRLIDAINAHDLDALAETFADGFASEWPAHPNRSFDGSEHVRKNWGMIFAQFPGIHITVTGSVESDDEFWGEFHYLRPGASDMRGVILIKVLDDKIVQSRFYMEEVEAGTVPHPMPGVSSGQNRSDSAHG